MKQAIIAILTLLAIASPMRAEDTPSFIKGSIEINFKTRTETDADNKLKAGVSDSYKMNLNVSNAAVFSGDVTYLPPMFSSLIGRETQSAKIGYRLDLSILNPKNVAQSKRIGRLVGDVPIDKSGAYRFNDGTLMVGVDAAGTAAGFESKFRGVALGKPPKNESKLAKIKKDAITLTREVGGKKISVVVKDYDKMTFQNLLIPRGPVQTYPDVTVSGEMVYDYERSAWYFRGVTLTSEGDKPSIDKLTGNIRWVESPQRSQNGEGEYQFDVRVNEPETKTGEAAVFAAPADENAFFESDAAIPALTGSAKYKDTFTGSGEEVVVKSAVVIDLVGNKLTKQQTMSLAKLLWLVNVVPMNAD